MALVMVLCDAAKPGPDDVAEPCMRVISGLTITLPLLLSATFPCHTMGAADNCGVLLADTQLTINAAT